MPGSVGLPFSFVSGQASSSEAFRQGLIPLVVEDTERQTDVEIRGADVLILKPFLVDDESSRFR